MTIQPINIGTAPNDGTGDPVRTAFDKGNRNFVELDTRTAAAQSAADTARTIANAALPADQKGAANGVAPLDSTSKVPAANLPSYVDDVLEFDDQAAFPNPGEAGKIYVALDTNLTWRWSGTTYVRIDPSPGSTDAVPEGSVNKYYTDARATALLTGAGGIAAGGTGADNAADARTNLDVYSKADVDPNGAAWKLPVYPANAIPTADEGPIALNGPTLGLMTWDGAAYVLSRHDHGQCQFRFVSATECRLFPYDGNGLIINGRQYRIPAAGVPLTISDLTAGLNTYYVYAKDNGMGGIALEGGVITSAPHATHVDGVEIKSGDPTRTLVGMLVYGSSGSFVFGPANRRVASWFNRNKVSTSEGLNGSTSSTVFVPITSPGSSFLIWNNSILESYLVGTSTSSVAVTGVVVVAYVDGQPYGPQSAVTIPAANYSVTAAALTKSTAIGDGLHNIQGYLRVNFSTGAFSGTLYATMEI